MSKKNQHVVPLGNGWAVKEEGNKDFSIITSNKTSALKFARQVARLRKSELVIHGKDGKIQDKDSYGNDPYPPKDKKK